MGWERSVSTLGVGEVLALLDLEFIFVKVTLE